MANSEDGWTLGAKISFVGLILTVIFGLIALTREEVRCWIGLDDCPTQSETSGANSSREGKDPQQLAPIVDAPPDPNQPYSVDPPPKRHLPDSGDPTVVAEFYGITNRGNPVAVPISGSGFTTHTLVEFHWFDPDGSLYKSDKIHTDERGQFAFTHLWWPKRSLGIEGNNGGWTAEAKDMTSGQTQTLQIDVVSDNHTPTPDQWQPENTTLRPLGPPKVDAGTSGRLCSDSGALSTLNFFGFTPGEGLEVHYLRADGRRVAADGYFTDGAGEVWSVQKYWTTAACDSNLDFLYKVVVIEPDTGRRAEANLGFTTKG